MDSKPVLASKTIIFAILTFVAAAAGAVVTYLQTQPVDFQDWQSMVPWILGMVVAVANAVLRILTTQPVKV